MSKTKPTVNDIPDGYLDCRDYGHTWKAYDGKIDRRMHVIHRVLRCNECKTLRHDKLSMQGNVLPGTAYQYPEDYLLKGAGRYGTDMRARVRLRNFRSQAREWEQAKALSAVS